MEQRSRSHLALSSRIAVRATLPKPKISLVKSFCDSLCSSSMGLKSFKDLEADKNPARILVTVFVGILIVAGIWFLTTQTSGKPQISPAADPLTKSTPLPPPELTDDQLKAIKINELRTSLEEASSASNFDEMSRLADELLELDPRESDAWVARGLAKQAVGDMAGALECFEKSIELSRDNSVGLVQRAKLYRQQNNLRAALSDLEEAGSKDPSDIEVASLILIVKIEAGNIDEVRSLIASYEQLGVSRHSQLWLLGAAAVALNDGNSDRAARAFDGFQRAVSPALFSKLLADPFFVPYQNDPAVRMYFPEPSEASKF